MSNNGMTSNKLLTDHDAKLRSWYLARLRKSYLSLELATQFTPNALVGEDRRVIEEQLLRRVGLPDNGIQQKSALERARIALYLGSATIAGATALLFFFFA